MSRPHMSPYRSKARWDSKHSPPWGPHNQRGAFPTSCVLWSCLPFWTANTSLKMNHSSSRSTSKFPVSSLLFIFPPTIWPHSPLFPVINPSFQLIYTLFTGIFYLNFGIFWLFFTQIKDDFSLSVEFCTISSWWYAFFQGLSEIFFSVPESQWSFAQGL